MTWKSFLTSQTRRRSRKKSKFSHNPDFIQTYYCYYHYHALCKRCATRKRKNVTAKTTTKIYLCGTMKYAGTSYVYLPWKHEYVFVYLHLTCINRICVNRNGIMWVIRIHQNSFGITQWALLNSFGLQIYRDY